MLVALCSSAACEMHLTLLHIQCGMSPLSMSSSVDPLTGYSSMQLAHVELGKVYSVLRGARAPCLRSHANGRCVIHNVTTAPQWHHGSLHAQRGLAGVGKYFKTSLAGLCSTLFGLSPYLVHTKRHSDFTLCAKLRGSHPTVHISCTQCVVS